MNPSHDLQGLKKKAKETFLYVLSALLLGIAIGAIDAVFGRVLLFITDFRSAHVVVLLPFLPLAGLGIVWLYRHFNETASKGMTLVMEAGQGRRESIPLALIPLVMAGTWITHLFGGSAGREGVAVQIGATLSHAFARRFHFPDNGRILLIAGMAAGFGGLFQTPFAAVFFAMEVVVSGSMAYSALLPAAIASFTASATSHALGLEKFSVLLSQTLSLTDTKTVTYLILFGILFGLTGRLFAVLLQKVKQFMGNVLENPYKRIGFVFEFADVLRWLSNEYNESRFSNFAEVISTSMRQLLPYEGHMCGIAKVGYYPEVVQHTSWDYGKNGKGYYNDIFAPGWTVASLWELFTPGRAETFMKK